MSDRKRPFSIPLPVQCFWALHTDIASAWKRCPLGLPAGSSAAQAVENVDCHRSKAVILSDGPSALTGSSARRPPLPPPWFVPPNKGYCAGSNRCRRSRGRFASCLREIFDKTATPSDDRIPEVRTKQPRNSFCLTCSVSRDVRTTGERRAFSRHRRLLTLCNGPAVGARVRAVLVEEARVVRRPA